MANVSPRPGIILVPCSTELLADQGEWSPPVRVMFAERPVAGEWEMLVERIPDLAEIRQQVQDLAHQLDRLNQTVGDAYEEGLDDIRQALHRIARGGD